MLVCFQERLPQTDYSIVPRTLSVKVQHIYPKCSFAYHEGAVLHGLRPFNCSSVCVTESGGCGGECTHRWKYSVSSERCDWTSELLACLGERWCKVKTRGVFIVSQQGDENIPRLLLNFRTSHRASPSFSQHLMVFKCKQVRAISGLVDGTVTSPGPGFSLCVLPMSSWVFSHVVSFHKKQMNEWIRTVRTTCVASHLGWGSPVYSTHGSLIPTLLNARS